MTFKNIFYKKNLLTFPSALAAALFLFGCSKQAIQQPPPPKVVVAPVISKEVHQYQEMVGEVIAKERVDLRARITGFIEKQNYPNGAKVKRGDVIFLIQKNQYKAQLEAAEADLMKAKAELTNATIDYNRKKYLVNKSAVSVVDFDLAATAKATAQSEVLTAKANLELAKLDYSYTEVKAPYDGVIGIANYDPGNLVSITSDPLVTLVMTDPILVEFNISESLFVDILQYHQKNKVKGKKDSSYPKIIVKLILSNGTEYEHYGEITFVNNEINSMTGTIRIRALFKNPHQFLIPGAYVKVKVMKNEKDNALLIPQASIQETQAGSYVLTVNDKNVVEEKFIDTDTVYGTDIIVTNGLKLGERVICQGLQKVRPGIKVSPVKIENDPTKDIVKKTATLKTAPEKGKAKITTEEKKNEPANESTQKTPNPTDKIIQKLNKNINTDTSNEPGQIKEQTK
ncbi:MAG TPA: efflux RND transporter periplasmic adaptor subunit [Victivallales bacterium]|nr:efflux RND transporter periplasmic adaptor subunit [Victivallales bacterium]